MQRSLPLRIRSSTRACWRCRTSGLIGDVIAAARGVGEQALKAVPVDVGEPVLRSGVRPFAAADHPRPCWPGAQVQQLGELDDLTVVPAVPSVLIAGCQASAGTSVMASWIL